MLPGQSRKRLIFPHPSFLVAFRGPGLQAVLGSGPIGSNPPLPLGAGLPFPPSSPFGNSHPGPFDLGVTPHTWLLTPAVPSVLSRSTEHWGCWQCSEGARTCSPCLPPIVLWSSLSVDTSVPHLCELLKHMPQVACGHSAVPVTVPGIG